MNFRRPWENISTLWHYLLLQFHKALHNLTLPNQISIPFPNPARDTHPRPVLGHLTLATNPDIFQI